MCFMRNRALDCVDDGLQSHKGTSNVFGVMTATALIWLVELGRGAAALFHEPIAGSDQVRDVLVLLHRGSPMTFD